MRVPAVAANVRERPDQVGHALRNVPDAPQVVFACGIQSLALFDLQDVQEPLNGDQVIGHVVSQTTAQARQHLLGALGFQTIIELLAWSLGHGSLSFSVHRWSCQEDSRDSAVG